MAESKKIKGSDLIAPDFLTNAIEQAEQFLSVIQETKKAIIDINKATSGKLSKASSGTSSKDIKDANALMAESIKQRKLATAAEVAETRAVLDIAKAKKALSDFEKKQQAASEKQRKATEQQNSAYAQTSKNLNQLRKDYKDLAIAGKANDKVSQDMLKTIQQLDKELKEVDASVGQFQRSVGDYKNQMSAAIEETGLFSAGLGKLGAQQNEIISGLGGIVKQLKSLKQGEEAAAAGAGKLGKTLKATGIGAIVAGLVALFTYFTSSREGALEFDLAMAKLKGTLDVLLGSIGKVGKGLVGLGTAIKLVFKGDFSEASEAASKAMDEISTSFDGNIDRTKEQIKGYEELARAIFDLEDQLLRLNVVMEQAKMDEEDFNEIQNDNTISLNRQKAALEGAIRARLTQAKVGKEIADKEYAIALLKLKQDLRAKQVSEEQIKLAEKQGYVAFINGKLTQKVSSETLKMLEESYNAQIQAADKLDDLDRQESERKRQIIQTETINTIELIRSKKLGADEQVKILTQQVADEKNQLEDREKFEEKLRAKQIEAQNEEVALFGKFGLKANEVQDLINEKDAVKLANNIKLLRDTRLSQEAADELAKVVLEAQTNDLAYEAQKAKFEEERIKREQKILQLNREIFIINEQAVLSETEKLEAEKQKILDDSNNKILENNNVYNRQLLAQRKQASLEAEAIIEEEYKIKEDLLQKQYEIDQENIKNSVNDELIREKELEKLQAKFNSEEAKLNDDHEKEKEDARQKEIKETQAIENRKVEIVVENLQKATSALSNELDRRQAIQDQKASYQIDKTQSNIDKQRDLAARGLANTLAYREAQLDKQKLKQLDDEKKAAKRKEDIALAEALLNAYNSELKQEGSNPTTAAAKALADVLLFKGLAAGMVQFAAEGNDRIQGPGTKTSDSIPFMLSKDEGVVKASANMENPGAVSSLNNGTFDQMYIPRYKIPEDNTTAQNVANSLVLQSNKEVIDLLKEIKNKPIQQVDVDAMGNLIETIYKDGMKTVTKYKNRRSIG